MLLAQIYCGRGRTMIRKTALTWLIILTAMAATAGCGILEQVNTTLNYTTEAAEFVNEANRFADRVPALAQQAVTNPEMLETLKHELQAMKDEIAAFNILQAPAFARDVHDQIVEYNEQIRIQIEDYLQQINENVIDLETLANSPMLETLRNLSRLLIQLEQLGQ